MSKKTTETKPKKQAVKKQPTELTEEELDKAQGGAASRAGGLPVVDSIGGIMGGFKPSNGGID